MLDKKVPYYEVIMIKDNPSDYPRYELPNGYSFCMYEDGFENNWAEVETAVGEFDEVSDGKEKFNEIFMPYKDELPKRSIFVKSSAGDIIATTTAWYGNLNGKDIFPRLHWVAVHPNHSGKGIAKALVTKALDIYRVSANTNPIYLTTQTWSYPAINIYLKLGFKPYIGQKPTDWKHETGDFDKDTKTAWEIIYSKIN